MGVEEWSMKGSDIIRRLRAEMEDRRSVVVVCMALSMAIN
jgi:hypothetical protein